jgi:hypothetical protein
MLKRWHGEPEQTSVAMALSANPILRLFLAVGDRDNPDCFRPKEVGDIVREDHQKTCSKGLERAVPFFTASRRAHISSSHAASTSVEELRLSSLKSRSIRAKVSRWTGGSSNASLAISASAFMFERYSGPGVSSSKSRKKKVESRNRSTESHLASALRSIDYRWDKSRKQKAESKNRRTGGHGKN